MIEILISAMKLTAFMAWGITGLLCAFSPFMVGVGEPVIGITLMIIAPFWVVITRKYTDKIDSLLENL